MRRSESFLLQSFGAWRRKFAPANFAMSWVEIDWGERQASEHDDTPQKHRFSILHYAILVKVNLPFMEATKCRWRGGDGEIKPAPQYAHRLALSSRG